MPFVKKGNVGGNIIPMENVPSQDFSLLSTTFEYIFVCGVYTVKNKMHILWSMLWKNKIS